jgi:hypothetical protein
MTFFSIQAFSFEIKETNHGHLKIGSPSVTPTKNWAHDMEKVAKSKATVTNSHFLPTN